MPPTARTMRARSVPILPSQQLLFKRNDIHPKPLLAFRYQTHGNKVYKLDIISTILSTRPYTMRTVEIKHMKNSTTVTKDDSASQSENARQTRSTRKAFPTPSDTQSSDEDIGPKMIQELLESPKSSNVNEDAAPKMNEKLIHAYFRNPPAGIPRNYHELSGTGRYAVFAKWHVQHPDFPIEPVIIIDSLSKKNLLLWFEWFTNNQKRKSRVPPRIFGCRVVGVEDGIYIVARNSSRCPPEEWKFNDDPELERLDPKDLRVRAIKESVKPITSDIKLSQERIEDNNINVYVYTASQVEVGKLGQVKFPTLEVIPEQGSIGAQTNEKEILDTFGPTHEWPLFAGGEFINYHTVEEVRMAPILMSKLSAEQPDIPTSTDNFTETVLTTHRDESVPEPAERLFTSPTDQIYTPLPRDVHPKSESSSFLPHEPMPSTSTKYLEELLQRSGVQNLKDTDMPMPEGDLGRFVTMHAEYRWVACNMTKEHAADQPKGLNGKPIYLVDGRLLTKKEVQIMLNGDTSEYDSGQIGQRRLRERKLVDGVTKANMESLIPTRRAIDAVNPATNRGKRKWNEMEDTTCIEPCVSSKRVNQALASMTKRSKRKGEDDRVVGPSQRNKSTKTHHVVDEDHLMAEAGGSIQMEPLNCEVRPTRAGPNVSVIPPPQPVAGTRALLVPSIAQDDNAKGARKRIEWTSAEKRFLNKLGRELYKEFKKGGRGAKKWLVDSLVDNVKATFPPEQGWPERGYNACQSMFDRMDARGELKEDSPIPLY